MFLPANVALSDFLPNIVENILFDASKSTPGPLGFNLDYPALVYHIKWYDNVLAFLSGLHPCAAFFGTFMQFNDRLAAFAQGFAARTRLEYF
ncbi:MAG TPA: hypothetical protein DCF33_01135 [Saprospirales bacterium]|nr:hypothetical protein [Saprospirales bacterium]